MGDPLQQFRQKHEGCSDFFCPFVVCSSHVLNKRSLLGGHQSHGNGQQGQHGHHQQHHQSHHRQRQQSRNLFGQRAGRDGDNHQDDSDDEIRAAPTGYLPADDYEYEEDLAEEAATRSEDIAGYSDDNLSGYENGAAAEEKDQAQYENEQGQYEDEQCQYDEA